MQGKAAYSDPGSALWKSALVRLKFLDGCQLEVSLELGTRLLHDAIKIILVARVMPINRLQVLHEDHTGFQRPDRLDRLPDHRAILVEPQSLALRAPWPTGEATHIDINAIRELMISLAADTAVCAIIEVPLHDVISHVQGLVISFCEPSA